MTRDFEYINYTDADRIAILENRAAELERRLLAALPDQGGLADQGSSAWRNVAVPPDTVQSNTGLSSTVPSNTGPSSMPLGDDTGADFPADEATGRAESAVRYAYEVDAYGDAGTSGLAGAGADASGPADGFDDDHAVGGAGASGPAGRTEALINHGRSRAKPARSRRILGHWRLIAAGAVALLAGIIAAIVALGSGSASWPSSVTTVQAEIKQACENPDVAAEPSGLNFACGKDTQSVLWVVLASHQRR